MKTKEKSVIANYYFEKICQELTKTTQRTAKNEVSYAAL